MIDVDSVGQKPCSHAGSLKLKLKSLIFSKGQQFHSLWNTLALTESRAGQGVGWPTVSLVVLYRTDS